MFNTNLKKMMERKGISQSDLSKLTGIGKPSISQYLSGKNIPGAAHLQKIAEALDCTPEELKGNASVKTDTAASNPERHLTVIEAAKRMGKSKTFLYDALQSGNCPFGFAVKGRGNKWTYFIPAQRFEKYIQGGI